MTASEPGGAASWLAAVRRYALFTAAAHLAWETLQVPLYTIWREASVCEIAFAVLHCSAGDVAIAALCLTGALLLAGDPAWPRASFHRVAAIAVALGVAYTVYSEWRNTGRGAWGYSAWMPRVPPLGTGLSPLVQWVALPPLGLWWARKAPPAERGEPLGRREARLR